jgi:hypothetical protein
MDRYEASTYKKVAGTASFRMQSLPPQSLLPDLTEGQHQRGCFASLLGAEVQAVAADGIQTKR